MGVKIGSARISENGTINGAKGDQTKNEVGTQDWYLHSKGWVCLRAKSEVVAEKIAWFVEAACSNDNFGYGQNDRDSSFTALKKVGFNPQKITSKVNVDCSLLVLEALRYAGVNITYDGENPFYTGNMVQRIGETGQFDILTTDAYCKKSDNLKRGDILVTKTKGHTVTALSNGANLYVSPKCKITLDELEQGATGSQVTTLQTLLVGYGYNPNGIDGKFGGGCKKAVIKYQKDHADKCGAADGIVGCKTWSSLLGV